MNGEHLEAPRRCPKCHRTDAYRFAEIPDGWRWHCEYCQYKYEEGLKPKESAA